MYRLGLYWNTIRYLRLRQITSRIFKLLTNKIPVNLGNPVNSIQREVGNWVEPAKRSQRMFGENTFIFVNVSHDINTVNDWNNEQREKLWLYNLHYFDDLTAVNAEQRSEWHCSLMQRWIDENPAGQGNGWEPYPSSLRIVNWIKWSLAGNTFEDSWLHALAVQVRYLCKNLETHLLGNHLFANAKALCFAGLFFDGEEADHWYKTGLQLIEREVVEQLCDDGGNFELSTMYHIIFLEDLLDLVNLHRAYGRVYPEEVEGSIAPMFKWLQTMCHPDGEMSFFNDAALGITPTVAEIEDYGVRLSLLSLLGCTETEVLIDLPESGYSRVAMGDAVALIDRAAVGPDYLPGHAHADTLSFELSLFGQRVVVNSGTSVYGTGKQRQLERGTVAHATVVIDGENSSEVWGGFRVARRAKVFNREQDEKGGVLHLSACHDGYKRLVGKPIHCREWLFEEGMMTVKDTISGKGSHEVMSLLPLHPDVKVGDVEDNQLKLVVSGNEVVVKIEEEAGREGKLEVVTDSYHPEFGMSVENRKLVYRSCRKLPIVLTTMIEW